MDFSVNVLVFHDTWGSLQYKTSPEMHTQLKYHDNTSSYEFRLSCVIIVQFRTWHGSTIAMCCAKLQNDRKNKNDYERTKFHEIPVL